VQDRVRKIGLSPAYEDGAKFKAQIRTDHERFGKIIQDAGIVPN
jgi:tripartite-type tricarboxylate transporter receptor subunit TctC